MSKLKPCPFCGGEAVETKFYTSSEPNNYKYSKQRAKCSSEACILGDAFELDVEAWNSRPIEDEQAKLIEKLALALMKAYKGILYDDVAIDVLKAYKEWKDKHEQTK